VVLTSSLERLSEAKTFWLDHYVWSKWDGVITEPAQSGNLLKKGGLVVRLEAVILALGGLGCWRGLSSL